MISEIIRASQKGNYYGAGEAVEIAKGKNEYTMSFKGFKRKFKRVWRSRRK